MQLTKEQMAIATDYGYFGLVYTPENVTKFVEERLNAYPENERTMFMLTIQSVVNCYAVEIAKIKTENKAEEPKI